MYVGSHISNLRTGGKLIDLNEGNIVSWMDMESKERTRRNEQVERRALEFGVVVF